MKPCEAWTPAHDGHYEIGCCGAVVDDTGLAGNIILFVFNHILLI